MKSTLIVYFIFRCRVDNYFVNQTYTNITVQKDEMETIIPPIFGNDMTFCEVITPEKLHLNFSSQPKVKPDKLRYLFHENIYHCISSAEISRLKLHPNLYFLFETSLFWLKYGWR